MYAWKVLKRHYHKHANLWLSWFIIGSLNTIDDCGSYPIEKTWKYIVGAVNSVGAGTFSNVIHYTYLIYVGCSKLQTNLSKDNQNFFGFEDTLIIKS